MRVREQQSVTIHTIEWSEGKGTTTSCNKHQQSIEFCMCMKTLAHPNLFRVSVLKKKKNVFAVLCAF